MSSACSSTIRTRLAGAGWRRRRSRAGLTEADVERRIGADPGAITQLEAGRVILDEVTERRILAVLTLGRR